MLGKIKKKVHILFNETLTQEQRTQIQKGLEECLQAYDGQFAKISNKIESLAGLYGASVFQIFFQLQFNLKTNTESSENLWRSCLLHHKELCAKVGELDFRASFLDSLTRLQGKSIEPVIIESSHLKRLQKDTVTDSLTGLFNKRYLMQVIDREVERAKRRSTLCSLIFLDLDHFKKLNDQYGHLSGDRVLQEVSHIIMENVRSCDLPCRYGGEEFAILLPDTDKEGAKLLADRIREQVSKLNVEKISLPFTLSGGVACFPQDAQNTKDLIQFADQSMYRAKSMGRNRIETYKRFGDKRHHQRKPIKLSGSLFNDNKQSNSIFTKNLSHSGLLLESNDALSLGATVQLNIQHLDGEKPISIIVHVVHLNYRKAFETFELGVRILHMEAEDQINYHQLLAG